MTLRGERGIWQRRYWEHTICDDQDFAAHFDYVHFNPVKRGLLTHPDGLAALDVSTVRGERALSNGLGSHQRRTAANGRAGRNATEGKNRINSCDSGMRYAVPPYADPIRRRRRGARAGVHRGGAFGQEFAAKAHEARGPSAGLGGNAAGFLDPARCSTRRGKFCLLSAHADEASAESRNCDKVKEGGISSNTAGFLEAVHATTLLGRGPIQPCMRERSRRTLASSSFASRRCLTRSPILTMPFNSLPSITGR